MEGADATACVRVYVHVIHEHVLTVHFVVIITITAATYARVRVWVRVWVRLRVWV